MTPEREAQMRELFETAAKDKALILARDSVGNYVMPTTAGAWFGFLACARALEPMVRDGERYAWLRENWHDGKGCWCDSLYAPANLDKAIDAAMSAALEDGNADV